MQITRTTATRSAMSSSLRLARTALARSLRAHVIAAPNGGWSPHLDAAERAEDEMRRVLCVERLSRPLPVGLSVVWVRPDGAQPYPKIYQAGRRVGIGYGPTLSAIEFDEGRRSFETIVQKICRRLHARAAA